MSANFDGFHLPGLDEDGAGVEWAELQAGSLHIRYPVLSESQTRDLAARLRASRDRALAHRPVAQVVRAIDAATVALTGTGGGRALALELLPHATRMSPPMVELILDRMAADWRTDALERLLRSELGDPAVLDRFVADPAGGRSVRALGPRLALNVFAGNVPGVAVTALVRCLLVKSAVIGKTAADDPVLPVLFARALSRVDPELGACVGVTYWPGGSAIAEEVAIEKADTIVVYGGDRAVRSVRVRAPGGTRVLEHGPRISLGFVAREALEAHAGATLSRDVALAAATFDQHGCVSLHGAFVERGGAVAPRDLARMVFEELRALAPALPPGSLLPQEAAALHAERARSEFTVMADGGAVFASDHTDATVVYSERPDATPSCLHRFVRVSAVDDLGSGIVTLAPLAGLLQTAALAAPAGRVDAIAEDLGRAGFTRICGFAAMPWPPPDWHHDGASPLRELVRWVDLEGDPG